MGAARSSRSRTGENRLGLSIALMTALAAGCGGGGKASGGRRALAMDRTAARGVLSYAVAFAGDSLVSVELGARFELVIRAVEAGGQLRERGRVALGPPDWDVGDLAVDAAGRTAYVASAAGTVRAIDLAAVRVVAGWNLGAPATAVAIAPDGSYLAAGSATGVVCLRRLPDGALLQCAAVHRDAVSGLDFDRGGKRLASSSWDGRVAVWSVPALAATAELEVGGSANQVAFAPDGERLAIATSARPPRRSPEVAAAEASHGGYARPDRLARVLVWRPGAAAAGAVSPLLGHRGPVTAVAWSADARFILSVSWDRTVRLWDVHTGLERGRVDGFAQLLRDVAVARRPGLAAAAAWSVRADDPATVLLALGYPPYSETGSAP